MLADPRAYLNPYVKAVQRHGAGFGSLLWASPQTQAARFDALLRLFDFSGCNVLDAGCGTADLLDHLVTKGTAPAHYVGIEAMSELAEAARRKHRSECLIVEADFVREPARLLVGADVIVFCGSLNTLDSPTFYTTLRHAYEATAAAVAFNFLSSRRLAAAEWLTCHRAEQVMSFMRGLGGRATQLDDYMDGDCTIVVHKGVR